MNKLKMNKLIPILGSIIGSYHLNQESEDIFYIAVSKDDTRELPSLKDGINSKTYKFEVGKTTYIEDDFKIDCYEKPERLFCNYGKYKNNKYVPFFDACLPDTSSELSNYKYFEGTIKRKNYNKYKDLLLRKRGYNSNYYIYANNFTPITYITNYINY